MVAALAYDDSVSVPGPVLLAERRSVATPRSDPEVYFRRRLLAAGLLLLAIAAALVIVQPALAGTGGGPLATTGAAAGGAVRMAPAGSSVWVVRPGDTLWSIARAVQPSGDPRAVVDRLAAEVGGSALYPGETIALPGR